MSFKSFDSLTWMSNCIKYSKGRNGESYLDPVEVNLSDELTPYVVFIGPYTDDTKGPVIMEDSSGNGVSVAECFIDSVGDNKNNTNISFIKWEPTDNYFSRTIYFDQHKKGYIFRKEVLATKALFHPSSTDEVNPGGKVPTSSGELEVLRNLYLPKVKTYVKTGKESYTEVYDSAEINIFNGSVKVFTDQKDLTYLVVIY